jgi:hypothetical protein
MAIKVYFGPHKHSPAPELFGDERLLWLDEFDKLRGYDRDFWTNNPLMLDMFEPAQVRFWYEDRWQPLPEVADKVLPDWRENEAMGAFGAGRLAMTVELISKMQAATNEPARRGDAS